MTKKEKKPKDNYSEELRYIMNKYNLSAPKLSNMIGVHKEVIYKQIKGQTKKLEPHTSEKIREFLND